MARDPFSSMWEDACELLYQAEQRQRRFFRRSGSALRRASWRPPIDVFESADTISVLVALPGVAPSQLQVVLDTGALFVRGERGVPAMTGEISLRGLVLPVGRPRPCAVRMAGDRRRRRRRRTWRCREREQRNAEAGVG